MDNTTLHPLCASQAHHIDLHLWRGPPENLDETRPIQILVNQGYVVGFCPARLQPAWSAYRVAYSQNDVDYDRPIHYHDDLRLSEDCRIGMKTFGKLGNIGLQVGHMTPNEVINRQFGRLAQLETFLMSNMSPQYGSLNGGVWLKLETAIREIKDEAGKDHVWATVGPIFGDQPTSIQRGPGKQLPVPDAYFCIMVDPHSYPFEKLSNVQIDCFIIPQDAPPSSNPLDYPATLEEIEQATKLKFFSAWGRDVPLGVQLQSDEGEARSRLMQSLRQQKAKAQPELADVPAAQPEAKSLDGLIQSLRHEADALQGLERALSPAEENRLVTIQHTISWLLAARQIGKAPPATEVSANFITYNIVTDFGDRLKHAARTACNFWNRFVEPAYPIVIRLDIFTQQSTTIARAYEPYEKDGVRYGRVEFNTKYLADFSANETAGTIVHEIGHTLGIGWERWDALFDATTGRFSAAAIADLALLEQMEVELQGGSGTAFSHWSENRFDRELMTGYKDSGEHVLPVTIALMHVLGHTVIEPLEQQTNLDALLDEVSNMVFSRQDDARQLDLEHLEETRVFETIPHQPV